MEHRLFRQVARTWALGANIVAKRGLLAHFGDNWFRRRGAPSRISLWRSWAASALASPLCRGSRTPPPPRMRTALSCRSSGQRNRSNLGPTCGRSAVGSRCGSGVEFGVAVRRPLDRPTSPSHGGRDHAAPHRLRARLPASRGHRLAHARRARPRPCWRGGGGRASQHRGINLRSSAISRAILAQVGSGGCGQHFRAGSATSPQPSWSPELAPACSGGAPAGARTCPPPCMVAARQGGSKRVAPPSSASSRSSSSSSSGWMGARAPSRGGDDPKAPAPSAGSGQQAVGGRPQAAGWRAGGRAAGLGPRAAGRGSRAASGRAG